MKKLIFFIAILTGLLFLSYSQEYQYVHFPDSGAIWSEMYNPSMGSNELLCYERFSLTGEDTLINDISYKKLYIFYTKVFDKSNARCVGGIREDDQKRVYYNGEGIHSFKPSKAEASGALLYDFSVSVGDSIKNGNTSRYDEVIIIRDIDTIQIGNKLRKVYTTNTNVVWIEGIGNIRGLLFSSGGLPTNGTNGDLICYIQNDTVFYHNDYYDDCFPSLTGMDIEKTNFDITICINLGTGNSIHFEWGNKKIKKLEIFDLKGIYIGSSNTTGKTFLEYPAEKLRPGIYLYKATDQNGAKQTGKFSIKLNHQQSNF